MEPWYWAVRDISWHKASTCIWLHYTDCCLFAVYTRKQREQCMRCSGLWRVHNLCSGCGHFLIQHKFPPKARNSVQALLLGKSPPSSNEDRHSPNMQAIRSQLHKDRRECSRASRIHCHPAHWQQGSMPNAQSAMTDWPYQHFAGVSNTVFAWMRQGVRLQN